MPTKRAATPPTRPYNGDEDDDETPTSIPRETDDADDDGDEAKPKLKGGWGASQNEIDSTSQWAQAFRPDEKSQVLAFLEDKPYVGYRRHWIETVNEQGAKTNRPYTCYQAIKQECPLCKAGDKPQAVSCFNIALIDENGDPTLKSWDVGARLFNVLKAYSGDTKIGPLPKGFFLVSKTGNKSTTQYNVTPIKASALAEDYGVQVPAKADLDALVKYTSDIVEITPRKKMMDLADELSGEYD